MPFVTRRPNPIFSPEYRAIVEILVQARRRAGLSQRALAALLDKTPSHIAMIERGQRRVDLLEFYRLARALDTDPQHLFREVAGSIGSLSDARSADLVGTN